jgi:hypothetical protein
MTGRNEYKHFTTGEDGQTVVEIKAQIMAETDKAFLLSTGDDEQWFPKSQIDWELTDNPLPGAMVTFYIPQWLVDKKGW